MTLLVIHGDIEDGDRLDPGHRHAEGDATESQVDLVDGRVCFQVGLCILQGRLELIEPIPQCLEVVATDQGLAGRQPARLGQPARLVGSLAMAPPAVSCRPARAWRRNECRSAPGAARHPLRQGNPGRAPGLRHCVESSRVRCSRRGSAGRGTVAWMPIITGLGGVLISTSVARFETMRAFYVEGLGLAPRSDRAGFVNFDFGGQRLTVAVHSEISGRSQDPLHVMVHLITPDAGAAFSAALAAGAPAVRSPSPEKWGGLVATVADPDGNLIQFLQLPSPVVDVSVE